MDADQFRKAAHAAIEESTPNLDSGLKLPNTDRLIKQSYPTTRT